MKRSAATNPSARRQCRDGLRNAVRPVAIINKPRTRRPAFSGLTRTAKHPRMRLNAPQTIPRMAALRIFLRAQTTRRDWFSVREKKGSVCIWAEFLAGNMPWVGGQKSDLGKRRTVRAALAFKAERPIPNRRDLVVGATTAKRERLRQIRGLGPVSWTQAMEIHQLRYF